jgi:hypothetical protein
MPLRFCLPKAVGGRGISTGAGIVKMDLRLRTQAVTLNGGSTGNVTEMMDLRLNGQVELASGGYTGRSTEMSANGKQQWLSNWIQKRGKR